MAHLPPQWRVVALLASLALLLTCTANAAAPKAADALKLKPVQKGIEYETPDADQISKCSVVAYKKGQTAGWEVRNPLSSVLRRYLDTNGDGKIDLWCYFQNGIEVYRDIDGDYDGRADQYRWLGTAGIRWAIDEDEDGKIDRWKAISPEEVTEEAILAMSNKDADRFKLLLMTPDELRGLGLGTDKAKELAKQLVATSSSYEKLLQTQKIVADAAQWVNFGGTRPGVVPAGTDGSTKDLHVYENVAAVVETDGKHNQVVVGTLIQVGNVWRLVDLPRSESSKGFFFTNELAERGGEVPVTGGLNPKVAELIAEMERVDKDLLEASTPETLAPLNAQRADILEQLAAVAENDADREIWIRQLADTVSAAAQSGEYPEGIERLAQLVSKLDKQNASDKLVSYVEYSFMQADYTYSMQQPGVDFAKVQEKWLADLNEFVENFPTSPNASDAMLQLAIAEEFAGNDAGAVAWYGRIAKEFAGTPSADKAAGAKRRIESVGQPLVLRGTTVDGKEFDVQSARGKVVLVHYWSTLYSNCLPGLSVLKDMQAKYGQDQLVLVGVNVDGNREAFSQYLRENSLPWVQLHEEGGLDSPLANAYGVLVLPTIILADQQGKVVNRNLDAGQVDSELRRLLR